MTTPKTNPEQRIKRVAGSREAIWGILANNEAVPLDLSDLTVVCRVVDNGTGTVIVNNQAATLEAATEGKVSYAPSADEAALLLAGGVYAVYFLIDTDDIDRRFPYDGPNYLLDVVAEYGG